MRKRTELEQNPVAQESSWRGHLATDAKERGLPENVAGGLAHEDRNPLGNPAGQPVVVLVRM
jgi:hypothetical protein